MSLKKILLQCLVVMAIAVFPLSACYAVPPKNETETVKITSAGRDKATLNLEVAIDPKVQERGLMGRTSMAKDAGMIFIFPDNVMAKFWMKNTLIPLDMIFVDQDGRIVDIHPMAKPMDETGIFGRFPCRAVIELNGGQAKALKLEIGDLVLSDALDRAVKFGTGVSE